MKFLVLEMVVVECKVLFSPKNFINKINYQHVRLFIHVTLLGDVEIKKIMMINPRNMIFMFVILKNESKKLSFMKFVKNNNTKIVSHVI